MPNNIQNQRESKPRLRHINRDQIQLRPTDVEKLIPVDHIARAIWELMGKMDLNQFYQAIQVTEDSVGSPAYDPRLLCSVWLYAYSEGINLARELSRLCEYHPGFQWLTGMDVINYHSLSDFRKDHKEALDNLFSQVLAAMSIEGLIDLKRVMHDGTKIKANAGADSCRRKGSVEKHLEIAREYVTQLEDPLQGEETSPRKEAAQKRAAREKQARLEKALEEVEKTGNTKKGQKEKDKVRVSKSDPESRIMKQGNGGYGPSYNVQISTDAKEGIIVGVGVCQSASDYNELEKAVDEIERTMKQTPEQMVADGGYTSRENIIMMEKRGIEYIGSMQDAPNQAEKMLKKHGVNLAFAASAFNYDPKEDQYLCPGGKHLPYLGRKLNPGKTEYIYRAESNDCHACQFKSQCCPNAKNGRSVIRSVEDPAVIAFKKKMETESAKAIYQQRGPIAEFPNAWIKEKIGLRQFRLRGKTKVGIEALWACLTYNIQQWLRLRKKRSFSGVLVTA